MTLSEDTVAQVTATMSLLLVCSTSGELQWCLKKAFAVNASIAEVKMGALSGENVKEGTSMGAFHMGRLRLHLATIL